MDPVSTPGRQGFSSRTVAVCSGGRGVSVPSGASGPAAPWECGLDFCEIAGPGSQSGGGRGRRRRLGTDSRSRTGRPGTNGRSILPRRAARHPVAAEREGRAGRAPGVLNLTCQGRMVYFSPALVVASPVPVIACLGNDGVAGARRSLLFASVTSSDLWGYDSPRGDSDDCSESLRHNSLCSTVSDGFVSRGRHRCLNPGHLRATFFDFSMTVESSGCGSHLCDDRIDIRMSESAFR